MNEKRGRWEYESDEDEAKKSKHARKKHKESSKSTKDAKTSELSAESSVDHRNSVNKSVTEDNSKNKISDNLIPRLSVPTLSPKSTVFNFASCRTVDNYERLNFIDQGTYGMVFRAKCMETSEIYALKQVKLGPDEVNKGGFPITALREINILLALQHPNIIKVREMVIGSTIDKIFMVMEYCENDLKTCMKQFKQSFSIAEIKQLMIQLLSAIEFMHSKWYIHRDLKTSNLLYSNKGVLCVCDFGLARKYHSPLIPYTFEVVTLWYRAPELLLGNRIYSTAIDMWSVGCIFAEMLIGEVLFPGEGEIDQISKIFRVLGMPTEERWPGFSAFPNANKLSWRLPSRSKLREIFPSTGYSGGLALTDVGLDLMQGLLTPNPQQRFTATQALQHPWLTSELPRPTQPDFMPVFRSRHE